MEAFVMRIFAALLAMISTCSNAMPTPGDLTVEGLATNIKQFNSTGSDLPALAWKTDELHNLVEHGHINNIESELHEPTSKQVRLKRNAIRGKKYRWINQEIPYEFEANVFKQVDIKNIKDSMKEWEKHTCLRFVKSKSIHRNKIRFVNGDGCSSNIGMIGGVQNVTLGNGCRGKKKVLRELGHAIGFYHEQSRPDRDSYITVNYDNIRKGKESNFRKNNKNKVETLGPPYDYKSIMHYHPEAFSVNKRPVIKTHDKKFHSVIGKNGELSFHDIRSTNLLYNCDVSCQATTACPQPGFRGKDCKCWCPGEPVQICR